MVAALTLGLTSCASGAPTSGAGGGDSACVPGSKRGCYTGPAETQGKGACRPGTQTCTGDGVFGPCEGEVTPVAERCDTPADDDCDGSVNEKDAGCICEVGMTQPCYSGPAGTEGVGVCVGGMSTCVKGTSWSSCAGEVTPAPDDCTNALDEDCSGSACSAPVWGALYGGTSNDRGRAIAVDANGNTYITGKLSGTVDFGAGPITSAGGDDAFLLKLDPTGKPLWSKAFGDAGDQSGTAIAIAPSGNVLLGGYYSGTITFEAPRAASDIDGFLAEIDPDGKPIWSARIGGPGDDKLWGLAVGPMGEIVVAGAFNGTHYCSPTLPPSCRTSAGGDDIFVRKYGADHTLAWVRAFGSPGDQAANGVAIDSAGNVVLTGDFQGTLAFGFGSMPLDGVAGHANAFVAKLAPTATMVLWSQGFGDSEHDQRSVSIALDAADQPIIAGTFEGSIQLDTQLTSAGGPDVFVAKLGTDGKPLWSRSYGDAEGQYAQHVAVDAGGNAMVTGFFDGTFTFGGPPVKSAGGFDIFLLKLSPVGEHLWSKGFGDMAPQFGLGVAADPTTSQVVLTGYASGSVDLGLGPLTSAGGEDIVVARFQP